MKEFLTSLALSCLAVFAPIEASIITVGVLICADLIIGIWASVKRGSQITSAGFRRTVTKMAVYEVALMLGYITEHFLIGDILPIAKIVAGMIGITELKSIYENLNYISGQNLLDSAIKKLGSENDSKDEP